MVNKMNELEACPFCGGMAYLITDPETETKYGVKCFNCDCEIPPENKTREEAIEKWNRRVKMDELNKLEEYLKAYGCEYSRYDSGTKICKDSCIINLNRHQIVVYYNGNKSWDAICNMGSYGYEEGLLEIYGDIVWEDIDGDSVVGWLTAQDVINRIEHGRDGARMNEK